MSCLFMDIPDFEYEKCVYWIEDGCKDNDPNCGNGDALCNETIERTKQLEETINETDEILDMLYCEHYDREAWRDSSLVIRARHKKVLGGKDGYKL